LCPTPAHSSAFLITPAYDAVVNVSFNVQGQATDIDIQAREILRMREELNRIRAHHTGQSMEKIQQDTDRDFFMTAEQAKEYGIVDEVICSEPTTRPDPDGAMTTPERRAQADGGCAVSAEVRQLRPGGGGGTTAELELAQCPRGAEGLA
jgi:hypothetical protein